MRVCKRFLTVVTTSAIISILCFVIGIYISYTMSTPTGASIVIINLAVFAVFAVIGNSKSN